MVPWIAHDKHCTGPLARLPERSELVDWIYMLVKDDTYFSYKDGNCTKFSGSILVTINFLLHTINKEAYPIRVYLLSFHLLYTQRTCFILSMNSTSDLTLQKEGEKKSYLNGTS